MASSILSRMALCTVSETNMNDNSCILGNDLWNNILSRLPPKPLVRCKCISKTWHHLISTFIHSQRMPLSALFLGFVDLRKGNAEFIDYVGRGDGEIESNLLEEIEMNIDDELSFLPCHPNTRIIDCRDGFVLCSSTNVDEEYAYYVGNPVTRQWVALPLPPEPSSSRFDVNAALAFDDSTHISSSHYKVIRFITVFDDIPDSESDSDVESCEEEEEEEDPLPYFYVDMFSSETGRWEGSNVYFKPPKFFLFLRPPVFLDGALYLMAGPHHVLRYDVKEDCCKVIDLPIELGMPLFSLGHCLGVSEGRLNYAFHNGSKMKVWMLDGCNTIEWVLKHSIDLDDVEFPDPSVEVDPTLAEPLDVFAFHPSLDTVFLRDQGDFLSYNFHSGKSETVVCYHPSATVDMLIQVYPFSACVYSLGGTYRRL